MGFRLSLSNIAWAAEDDEAVYQLMAQHGFQGLEIAPARIMGERPYEAIEQAAGWAESLASRYGFCIPSMQSVLYGRTENLFGTHKERLFLLEYLKQAVCFAASAGCRNLVFGCPKNRMIPKGTGALEAESLAESFFREIGDYAYERGTVIGLEANPPSCQTNFMNDTKEVLEFVKRTASRGLRLNLDTGTVIENGEDIRCLASNVHLISHVHISEPGLAQLVKRKLHAQLASLLEREHYSGFVSVEMRKGCSSGQIGEIMEYVRSVFADTKAL